MKSDRKKIVVNNSHVWLRTVCFVLALVVGVGAISFGFARIGHKDPGYYEIETAVAEEAPLYQNGFTLIYYFEGDSSAIKREMNALKELYSATLLRSYKLLDAENTYDGFANLASLNQNLGQPVQVSEELLAILEDAWNKTREERGFNLFAGALYQEWDSILTLDDISEFDPVTNPDTASRIQALAEKTGALDSFDLRILDRSARTVQVSVSQDYLDFLKQNEYGETVISVNLMSDAYRLDLVRNALEAQGYTNGYLYTDSGLTLSLFGHEGGAYGMYSYDGTNAQKCAAINAEPNSASSYFRVFPLEEQELMYHVVSDENGVRYYHPCFVTATGTFADVLSASCAVRYDGDVVECCYANLILFNLTSREAVSNAAEGNTTVVCSFRSDGEVLYTNNAAVVTPSDGMQLKTF